ncbi:aldolase/citrate lyase family protein [Novosphingobium jiangmenense]
MNIAERHMLDLLKHGRDYCGFVAVKAEFEAEGTRADELLRLLEVAHRADLKVAIKIGGCEAVSDLLQCRNYGANYIIAPMVETPYALSKFVVAKNKVYGKNEQETEFLVNLETQATLENLAGMVPVAKQGGIDGIVFGRVDFTLSRGMPRGAINDPAITTAVLEVAAACAEHDLDLVVGGSVAAEAAAALARFRAVRLDRFETRKVVFDGAAAESESLSLGIATAVEFELTWLRNKHEYYSQIAGEDLTRIKMMEERQASRVQLAAVGR